MSDTPEGPIEVQVAQVRRPGWPWQRLAALAGAVALVAGGMFAVVALGDEGGDDPEDVVRAMLDAAADSDVLGVLEQLVPGEREALRDPLVALVDELERLGVLEGADLRDVSGVELAFDDVELTTTEDGDDLARVRVTGGIARSAVDPAALPLGPFLRDLLGGLLDEAEPTSSTDDMAGDDEVVTVKRGGRWYVSIGYSIAEAAREEAGVTRDYLGGGVAPQGADNPEGAVRGLFESAAALDLRGVIARLGPELEALQEYAGLYLPDADTALGAVGDQFEVRIDTLELSSEADGDLAVVKVDKLEGRAAFGGMELLVSGGCFELRGPDGSEIQRQCQGDAPPAALGDIFPFDLGGLAGRLGHVEAGITAVRVEGEWYVSPIRTVLDTLVAVLRALEPADLDTIREMVSTIIGGLEGAMFGTAEGYSAVMQGCLESAGIDPGASEPPAAAAVRAFSECMAGPS